MKYILFSRLDLEGFQTRAFSDLHGLYLATWNGTLKSQEGMHCQYTNNITEAYLFDSEEEAWKFATDTWGDGFAYETFGVLSVHPDHVANHRTDKIV